MYSATRDEVGQWEVVDVRAGPALIPVAHPGSGVTAEQIDAGTDNEWKIEYYLFIEGYRKVQKQEQGERVSFRLQVPFLINGMNSKASVFKPIAFFIFCLRFY